MAQYSTSNFPLNVLSPNEEIGGLVVFDGKGQVINANLNPNSTYPTPFVLGQALSLFATVATANDSIPIYDVISSTTIPDRVDGIFAYQANTSLGNPGDTIGVLPVSTGNFIKIPFEGTVVAGNILFWNTATQKATATSSATTVPTPFAQVISTPNSTSSYVSVELGNFVSL